MFRLPRACSLLAAVLLAGAVLIPAGRAEARAVVINPQAGLSASWFADELEQAKDRARIGYQVGGFVRIGQGRAFLMPGAFYQQTALELEETDDLDPNRIKDNLAVNSVHLPLLVGLNLTPSGPAGFRLAAGPSLTWVTGVKANDFGIEKDDYEDAIVGAIAGLGVDLVQVTIDLSYEWGLTDVFKDSLPGVEPPKQNVLRGNVGLRF